MNKVRIFRHHVPLSILLLALVEVVLFAVAFYAGAYLRYPGETSQELHDYIGPLLPRAMLFSVVMFVGMMSMGMYQARTQEGIVALMLRVGLSMAVGLVLLSVIFYLVPSLFVGRGATIIASEAAFVLIVVNRLAYLLLADKQGLRRRVLMLGAGKYAGTLAKSIAEQPGLPPLVVGFVPAGDEQPDPRCRPILDRDKPLRALAREVKAEEIVVAVTERRKTLPMEDLLACKLEGIQVVDANTFYERETGKVSLDLLNPGWLLFSDGYYSTAFIMKVRRVLDVLTAGGLLFLSLPITVIAGASVWVESGLKGPVFYRQTRVGANNRPFQVLKFRSMRTDAEKDGKAQWAKENDDRITRVGAVLRRTRIDELPQLFNVLRGDMSFIGPRPERPEFVSELSKNIPYYAERHRVKPGLTGWAQLCYPYGASEEDAAEKLQFDLYYLKNQSFFLDWLILVQTVEVVLFGRGAR